MPILAIALAAGVATSQPMPPCPTQRQALPAPLDSAAFVVPATGDTLLFSARFSFGNVHFALRLNRPADVGPARAVLFRLQRRDDCNVHDRTGEWAFDLKPEQSAAIFASVAALRASVENPNRRQFMCTDGTGIAVQLHASGAVPFIFYDNCREPEALSALVLSVVKEYVAPGELPANASWSYRAPNK